MIRLQPQPMDTVADLRQALQKAIELEFSTLPPYLYAGFTIRDGTNEAARRCLGAIVGEEMIHMALACNILNAIGGAPVLAHASVVPIYPGPLPYDIGAEGAEPFRVSLLPFSPEAMAQGMHIEEPEDPLVFPEAAALGLAPAYQTIGQFYRALDQALGDLPTDVWSATPRNQLTGHPFFAGELFPVTGYQTASEAIRRIVSDGEGNTKSPLDFEGELAHYYRFEEIHRDQMLQKDSGVPEGFSWGDRLGVDWSAVVPAIADPGAYDFSGDPPAQAAQDECDRAFTAMLHELERAVNGRLGRLGNAVRAMFDLRLAARAALAVPLAGGDRSAGPAFRFRTDLA
ncbi:MAG: ferritin-like domain-containing protein [Pseudonocardiaceae bacterium]